MEALFHGTQILEIQMEKYIFSFHSRCCSRVAGLCDQVARGRPVLAAGGHGAQGGHSGMQSFLS